MSLYGKIPCRGDYIADDAGDGFTEPWHNWLLAGFEAVERQLGEQWRQAFLTAPIWRFVLPADCCGPTPLVGVMSPSADAAGRLYPLTLYVSRPDVASPLSSLSRLSPWFEAAEEILLAALDDAVDLQEVRTRAATHSDLVPLNEPKSSAAHDMNSDGQFVISPSNEGLGGLLAPLIEPREGTSYWWSAYGVAAEVSGVLDEPSRQSTLMLCDGLPDERAWMRLVVGY